MSVPDDIEMFQRSYNMKQVGQQSGDVQLKPDVKSLLSPCHAYLLDTQLLARVLQLVQHLISSREYGSSD